MHLIFRTYMKSFGTAWANETCANCSDTCKSCTGPLTFDCTSCQDGQALTPGESCNLPPNNTAEPSYKYLIDYPKSIFLKS